LPWFLKSGGQGFPKNVVYKEFIMKDILIFGGIIAVWVLLQAVILPKFGVST